MARITDMNGNPLTTYQLHRAAYEWWALNADGYWERERAGQKLRELEEHPLFLDEPETPGMAVEERDEA